MGFSEAARRLGFNAHACTQSSMNEQVVTKKHFVLEEAFRLFDAFMCMSNSSKSHREPLVMSFYVGIAASFHAWRDMFLA
eukprot:4617932-Amphidinium_carterae.1